MLHFVANVLILLQPNNDTLEIGVRIGIQRQICINTSKSSSTDCKCRVKQPDTIVNKLYTSLPQGM